MLLFGYGWKMCADNEKRTFRLFKKKIVCGNVSKNLKNMFMFASSIVIYSILLIVILCKFIEKSFRK